MIPEPSSGGVPAAHVGDETTCRCGHSNEQHYASEPRACKKRCRCISFESPLPGQCEHGQSRPHEYTMLGRLPKLHCPGPADPVVSPVQGEAVETCRVVDVDGQPVRVRGGATMDDTDRAMLAEVVRAAKAKYMAEGGAERLAESLERLRQHLCGYVGQPTCDCKYGASGRGEQTGCPELRDAIDYLRTARSVPVRIAREGETRLVRQEHDYGCGIASLAMISSQTYDQVHAWLLANWPLNGGQPIEPTQDLLTKRGIHKGIADWYLARHGYTWRTLYAAWFPAEAWPPPPFAPVHLVNVQQPSGNSHYIVMRADGAVLDPLSDEPKRLDDWAKVNNVQGIWPGASS